jgi:hypothetical protein
MKSCASVSKGKSKKAKLRHPRLRRPSRFGEEELVWRAICRTLCLCAIGRKTTKVRSQHSAARRYQQHLRYTAAPYPPIHLSPLLGPNPIALGRRLPQPFDPMAARVCHLPVSLRVSQPSHRFRERRMGNASRLHGIEQSHGLRCPQPSNRLASKEPHLSAELA